MPGNIPYRASKTQYPYRVTVKLRQAFDLSDQPTDNEPNWVGYFHFVDPTLQKPNSLTYPSANCFIPFKDKIVPRLGSTLLGQPYTANQTWPIIGRKKRFGTASGIEVEVRVTQTNGSNPLGDIIEVLYPNPMTGDLQYYQITENTNPFAQATDQLGMKARYYFDDWFDTDLNPAKSLNLPRLVWVNGSTNIFSWTGGIGVLGSLVPNTSITTVGGVTWESLGFVPPTLGGSGDIIVNGFRYSVDDGWSTDTLLLADTSGISINDIAFEPIQTNTVNGPVTGTIIHGSVNGSGFVAQETITGSRSSATATVITDGGGTMTVLNVIGTFQSNETITGGTSLSTTIVTSYTQNTAPLLSFNMCSQNDNYMYYGNWSSRKFYQSNGFNKDSSEFISNVQAVQDDLILGTTPYTGTGQHVYRITIDSVNPDVNTQSFTGTGLNDGQYVTTNYSAGFHTPPNDYKVAMVADFTLVTGIVGGIYTIGETVTGGTSDAQGTVVTTFFDGTNQNYGIRMATDFGFQTSENVTGSNSTFVNAIFQALFQNWIQYSKNNAIVNIDTGSGSMPIAPLNINPITLSDGLTIQFSNFQGHTVGDVTELMISTNGADTFRWQIDGGTPVQTGVPIIAGTGVIVHGSVAGGPFQNGEIITGGTLGATARVQSDSGSTMDIYNVIGLFEVGETITGLSSGATTVVTTYTYTPSNQTLNNGVTISFASSTGHTLGDYWEITATQGVTNAWANFYYTLPTRIPGEGYIYNLSSNFWTMAPQESEMYVNTTYGDWAYVKTQLSANQQNETVSLTPLKQPSAMKVIWPYMIDYLDNYLAFVTNNKKLEFIGRQELIQLPQTANLSQEVDSDFQALSFENGSMEYWDRKLWINSPLEGTMLCYDDFPLNQYWQPPQKIPENGILSVVGENLITHSNLRNQSFTLFTSAKGDYAGVPDENPSNYTVTARTPYLSFGNRWGKKDSNKSFIEGYVQGNPAMKLNIYLGINGCSGILPHPIKPVVCIAPNLAPFGEGQLGSHPFASDANTIGLSHFNEIWPAKDTMKYYFAALELSCVAATHSYSWLTVDLDSVVSTGGNTDFINSGEVSRE